MHSMTAGNCGQCRDCAQWTHGSTWTGRAQTGTVVDIQGIMMIAMANIMERMLHWMDEKVQQLQLRKLKDDKNKSDLLSVSVSVSSVYDPLHRHNDAHPCTYIHMNNL